MLLKNTRAGISLPEEYHIAQNVVDVYVAQLVEIILLDTYKGLTRTEFTLDKPWQEGADTKHIIDMLVDDGQHDVVSAIVIKHVFKSVLEDFVEFVSESINALKSAKFTVAFSLLRKPFIDELLMFEEIFLDKNDYYDRYFAKGDTRSYDPSYRGEAVYKDIIERAVAKAPMNFTFGADILYEMRYDKETKHGLNWITNQALHIVTTDKRYKTLNQELNFVFSTVEDYEKYWQFYYSIVPFLLFYAVTIIDEIVFDLLPEQIEHKRVRAYRRIIARQAYRGDAKLADKRETVAFLKLLGDFSNDLVHVCSSCQTQINPSVDDLFWFAFNNVILCPNCKKNQLDDSTFRAKFNELD